VTSSTNANPLPRTKRNIQMLTAIMIYTTLALWIIKAMLDGKEEFEIVEKDDAYALIVAVFLFPFLLVYYSTKK